MSELEDSSSKDHGEAIADLDSADSGVEESPPPASVSQKVVVVKKKKPRSPIWFVKDVFVEIFKIIIIVLALRAYVVQASAVEGTSMEPTLHNGDYLLIERVTASLQHRPESVFGDAETKFDWFPRIERGDIVVLSSPENGNTELVKRVVAVSGDMIFFYDGQIYVNGHTVAEPYIGNTTKHYDDNDVDLMPDRYEPSSTKFKNAQRDGTLRDLGVKVPEKCFFVMGDNRGRNASNDSRAWSRIEVDQGPKDGANHLWVTASHIHGRVIARIDWPWNYTDELPLAPQ